jgi:tetratricopeptide (TPR) repeat protein
MLRRWLEGRTAAKARALRHEPQAHTIPGNTSPSIADTLAHAEPLAAAGRLADSLRALTSALDANPGHPDLLYARGLTLFDGGRHVEARRDFAAALRAGLASFALYLNLGHVNQRIGDVVEAERMLREAVRIDGSSAVAHVALAVVLQTCERYEEALQCLAQARCIDPGSQDIAVHEAGCHLDRGDPKTAEQVARTALDASTAPTAALCEKLAIALARQDRAAESREWFERAEALEAATESGDEVFVQHGRCLVGVGLPRDAIELYRRHLPTRPHPQAHANYGAACLTLGWLGEGWTHYDYRWYGQPVDAYLGGRRIPRWEGQDVRGATVLVWAEQGAGDLIQFARFAGVLKRRGAVVVLKVPARLRGFARSFDDLDKVVADVGEAGPIDFHVPLLSIPAALLTELDSIPCAVPYLQVDPVRAAAWRARMANGVLNVGLAWTGNPLHERDRYRSIPLATLAPLLEVPGIKWHSLQKDLRDDDRVLLAQRSVEDASADLLDFSDTAAAICALDLVVSVDTAVAHLAGALARRVWTLLPAVGDFRWLLGREDSPWYPTMRLFRQQALGNWAPVVQAVAHALVSQSAGSSASPGPTGASTPLVAREPIEGICRFAHARWGLLQYAPERDDEARALAYYGEHLASQVDLLAIVLPAGARMVEMAAGVGAHTTGLANRLPEAHLWVYEDDARQRRLLAQNLGANRLSGRVTIMNAARSPALGRGETDRVDDLVLESLDLIKVNDPRAVDRTLAGSADSLWRLRPALFLAMSDEAQLAAGSAKVKEFGYRCWRVATPLFDPANFNRRTDDRFGGRQALALLGLPEEREAQFPAAAGREL